jgi:hypothetical protein
MQLPVVRGARKKGADRALRLACAMVEVAA